MAIQKNLALAKTSLSLLKANPISKIILSLKHIAHSDNRKAALKLCLIYLAPRLYLLYHKIASSVRGPTKKLDRTYEPTN